MKSIVVALLCVVAIRGLAQAPPQRVSAKPSCPQCTITLSKIASFGHADDPALLTMNSVPSLDARGRAYMWSAERSTIAVFESSGKFLRTVGRYGGGPGEFEISMSAIFTGRGDSLYVQQRRGFHVLSPQYTYVRRIAYTGDVFGGFLMLPTGDVVASLQMPAKDVLGLPVHVLSPDGAIRKTLATGPPNADRRTCASCLGRRLALASRRSAFWSIANETYAFQEWSYAGDPLRSFVVDESPWMPADVSARIRSGEVRFGATTASISGAWEDPSTGFLWIVGSAGDGREPERTQPRRGVSAIQMTDSTMMARADARVTIVEVIDVDKRIVVASQRLNGSYNIAGAGSDLLYRRRQDADGIVYIDLWRATLNRPR